MKDDKCILAGSGEIPGNIIYPALESFGEYDVDVIKEFAYHIIQF